VEGELYSVELILNARLFEVQQASKHAQRNVPAQFIMIKRADSFTIHSIDFTYSSHTL
jgi:hypothetical protein